MIIRAPRGEHYTVLNTETFNIPMPPECLGVYLYLLSKPDDWRIQPEALAEHFGCSAQRIYKILKQFVDDSPDQLCVNGRPLIDRKRVTERGKVLRIDYVVHEPLPQKPLVENPQVDIPHVEKPQVEKPLVEKHHVTNNRSKQITDLTNNRDIGQNRLRFVPPTQTEVYEYMKTRGVDDKNEAEKFCDFYASKGWVVGKAGMKDWKASVRNWLKNYDGSKHERKTTLRERLTDTSWADGLGDLG